MADLDFLQVRYTVAIEDIFCCFFHLLLKVLTLNVHVFSYDL